MPHNQKLHAFLLDTPIAGQTAQRHFPEARGGYLKNSRH